MQHIKKKYFILIPIAILLVLPFIIMLLWNNIVIDVFSIKSISYVQALGLFVLSKILFGSFGFSNRRKPPFKNQFFNGNLMNLSTDDKNLMMEEWKKRNCNTKENNEKI